MSKETVLGGTGRLLCGLKGKMLWGCSPFKATGVTRIFLLWPCNVSLCNKLYVKIEHDIPWRLKKTDCCKWCCSFRCQYGFTLWKNSSGQVVGGLVSCWSLVGMSSCAHPWIRCFPWLGFVPRWPGIGVLPNLFSHSWYCYSYLLTTSCSCTS